MEDDKVNLSTWGEGKQQQQTKRNTLTRSAKKKKPEYHILECQHAGQNLQRLYLAVQLKYSWIGFNCQILWSFILLAGPLPFTFCIYIYMWFIYAFIHVVQCSPWG